MIMNRQKNNTNKPIREILLFSFLLLVFFNPVSQALPLENPHRIDRNPTANQIAMHNTNQAFLQSPSDLILQNLGQKINTPAHPGKNLVSGQIKKLKYLPPLPAAVIMVSIGFLCITFVRDRKFWLAGLFCLIWPIQYFFNALPTPVLLTEKQNHLSSNKSLSSVYFLRSLSNSHFRLFSNIAIKLIDNNPALLTIKHKSLIHIKLCNNNRQISSLSAAVNPSSFNSAVNLYDIISEKKLIFSPAFIFQNLSRAPPRFVC